MRNTVLRKMSSILRVLIWSALLLALFMMTSLPAWAYGQQRQDAYSPTLASQPNAPSGNAVMQWNQQNKVLHVALHLTGLQPGSNHAAHIHNGTCSAIGKVVYPFNNVVADKAGNVTATDTINNVSGGIPATGWIVAVHSGSTLQTSELLCGNVTNPQKATNVTVPLRATAK